MVISPDGDMPRLVTFFPCSCRPGVRGAPLPARAILSMGGLSHGVIRVNTEDKNSALTVQDVGHIMPGGQPLKQCTHVYLFQKAGLKLKALAHLYFSSDVHCEARGASSALQDR